MRQRFCGYSWVTRRLKKQNNDVMLNHDDTVSRGSGQDTGDSETPVGKTSVTRSGQFVQEGPFLDFEAKIFSVFINPVQCVY